MIFRRRRAATRAAGRRSAPRGVIAFHAAAFVLGLVYVLATTPTIETIRMTVDGLQAVSQVIQKASATTTSTVKADNTK